MTRARLNDRLAKLEAERSAVRDPLRVVLWSESEPREQAWRAKYGEDLMPPLDDPSVLWVELVGVRPAARSADMLEPAR